MKNLNFDSSRWVLLNNILVGAIALYGVANHNYKVNDLSVFQKMMIEVLAPLQRGTMSLKESLAYTIDHYVTIVNTSKENEKLRKKMVSLENQIFSLTEVKKENERLKQLLQFGKEIPREKVLAQIVSWDSSNEFKVLRINKGSVDGLKLMAPVITMTGLVGYVYRLSPNYADILTILDQNNRIDAIVARTRTHGIVEGHSGFKCRLKYVSRTEKLQVDDEIITAGLGEIYPKGIRVGRISKIDKENFGITQKIEITPSVNFHKLEEVVVLIENGQTKEVKLPQTSSSIDDVEGVK
ncbi:MAG: rod shape-determining protein MreC [Bacteriovoracaceae bacterium]|nr:rod shape-determining protein MreC [Halobacteriovoraceae bacterium]MDP7320729.1 rod shape-determining protein MreC [Bacteriovoracaceae bacterium]